MYPNGDKWRTYCFPSTKKLTPKWDWKMLQFGALVKGGHILSQERTIEPAKIKVSDKPLERKRYKRLMPSGMEVDIMRDGRDAVNPVHGSFPKTSFSPP